MRKKLMEMLESRKDDMIAIRRYLHQHPEVSFQEKKTAEYIKEFYKDKPVKVESEIGSHGVLVTINEGKSDDVLALRADFDALPIFEETGLDFASDADGVMHACGHDAHTAYLLVLADCLIELRSELPGVVKIIHQHAEEVPPGGARDFIVEGVLRDVKRIYGVHVFPFAQPGLVLYRSGLTMAGSGVFKLKITGTGGHGSAPHLSNDAIVAGAQFVVAAQSIVSRRVDPSEMAVVSIGHFDGVGQGNVIKDSVSLEASIRFFDKSVETLIAQELMRIANGIGEMFGVEVEAEYVQGYPPLVNDEQVVNDAVRVLKNAEYLDGIGELPIQNSSEDFASYLEVIPGAFFFASSCPLGVEKPYYNHNPKFDVNEDVLVICAKTMADLVIDYFKIV